jgi:hypothetical protein
MKKLSALILAILISFAVGFGQVPLTERGSYLCSQKKSSGSYNPREIESPN